MAALVVPQSTRIGLQVFAGVTKLEIIVRQKRAEAGNIVEISRSLRRYMNLVVFEAHFPRWLLKKGVE